MMIRKETRINVLKERIKKIDDGNYSSFINNYSSKYENEIREMYFSTENKTYISKALDQMNGYLLYDTKNENKLLPEEMYLIIVLAFVIEMNQVAKKTTKKIENEINLFNEKNVLYRGQSNSEWRLCPSVIRNLDKNIVFDDLYYIQMTKDNGLDDKINALMRHRVGFNAYDKYAFLQHACSFSPLIDLTHDKIIATSFALSNTCEFNIYSEKSSKIYTFKARNLKDNDIITDKNSARDFLKNDMKLYIIKSKKIQFGMTYTLNQIDEFGCKIKYKIKINSIPKLIKLLTPSYKFIDITTNDRMRYQQGAFLVLYGCLVIKDKIFYELNEKFIFSEEIIDPENKNDIKNIIYTKHREYDITHLLDPYKYFSE